MSQVRTTLSTHLQDVVGLHAHERARRLQAAADATCLLERRLVKHRIDDSVENCWPLLSRVLSCLVAIAQCNSKTTVELLDMRCYTVSPDGGWLFQE